MRRGSGGAARPLPAAGPLPDLIDKLWSATVLGINHSDADHRLLFDLCAMGYWLSSWCVDRCTELFYIIANASSGRSWPSRFQPAPLTMLAIALSRPRPWSSEGASCGSKLESPWKMRRKCE